MILIPAVEFTEGGRYASTGCYGESGYLVAYDNATLLEVARRPARLCRGDTWTISTGEGTSAP